MKVKYFRFWRSFLPQEMFKKLWIHNNKDINQNREQCLDLSKCHHRTVTGGFPWCIQKGRSFACCFCFLRWKTQEFLEMQNAWDDGKMREHSNEAFWLLLESSHVARSREDSWCWPSLGDKFGVFPCAESLPWSFITLQRFLYPLFSIAFCALLCDWVVTSLSCKSTKQFLIYFYWLLFLWLHSSALILFGPFLAPSLYLINVFLAFSNQDGRGEALLSWQREESNVMQCLTSTFLRHQRGPHCSPLARKKTAANSITLGTTALPGTFQLNQILHFSDSC